MSWLSGILKTIDPLGSAIVGKLTKKQKKAATEATAAAATLSAQTTEEQLANLNNQIAADQTGLAASAQSQKTWQYVAIGSVVLVVIGGALYFMIPKKKK